MHASTAHKSKDRHEQHAHHPHSGKATHDHAEHRSQSLHPASSATEKEHASRHHSSHPEGHASGGPASLDAIQSALGFWSNDESKSADRTKPRAPGNSHHKDGDKHTEKTTFEWTVKEEVANTPKKSATLRTHAQGLVRGSLRAGELFVGNVAAPGWVFGQSAIGPGWVKVTNLTRGKKCKHNPAGPARSIGRPKEYVNVHDKEAAKANGEGRDFTYTTPCDVMDKNATIPLYLDMGFSRRLTLDDLPDSQKHLALGKTEQNANATPNGKTQISLTPDILSHSQFGEKVKVRYCNGNHLGIMAFKLWLFCDKKFINLENLKLRLKHHKRSGKKSSRK